jgi:phage head maturation protease
MTEQNDFKIFSNFQKFDETQRMAYGYATTEALDSQDEIVELEATSEAVKDYKKWANIREMHSNSAVGTAPIIEMKKDGLWIGAHIVDDKAWEKVKAGVYKGFSIGGKIIDRVEDYSEDLGKVIKRIKKYMLTEISLVDRPANPLATFSFIKRQSDTDEVKEMTDELKKDVAEKEKEAVEEKAVEEATSSFASVAS